MNRNWIVEKEKKQKNKEDVIIDLIHIKIIDSKVSDEMKA